jgi:ribosome modulation factor
MAVEIKDHILPHLFHQWNRAMQGAYKKGVLAFREGVPLSGCPYQDKRKPSGRLSWSRAFESAWRDGWRDAKDA